MTIYARAMDDSGGSSAVAGKFYYGKVDTEIAVELELVLEGKNYKTGRGTGKGKGSRSVEIDGKMRGINSFEKRIDAYVSLCGKYGLDVDYGALSDSVLGNEYLGRDKERQSEVAKKIYDVAEDSKDEVLEGLVKRAKDNGRGKVSGDLERIAATNWMAKTSAKDVYGLDVGSEDYLGESKVYGVGRDDMEDVTQLTNVVEEGVDNLYELVNMGTENGGPIELVNVAEDEIIELTEVLGRDMDDLGALVDMETPIELVNVDKSCVLAEKYLVAGLGEDGVEDFVVESGLLGRYEVAGIGAISSNDDLGAIIDMDYTVVDFSTDDLIRGTVNWYENRLQGWNKEFWGMSPWEAIRTVEKDRSDLKWGIFKDVVEKSLEEEFYFNNHGEKLTWEEQVARDFRMPEYSRFTGEMLVDPWGRKPKRKVVANKRFEPKAEELEENARGVAVSSQSVSFVVDDRRDRESFLGRVGRKIGNFFLNF